MAEGALADDAGALLQLLRAVVLEQVVVPPVAGEAAADFRVGVLARRTVGLVGVLDAGSALLLRLRQLARLASRMLWEMRKIMLTRWSLQHFSSSGLGSRR